MKHIFTGILICLCFSLLSPMVLGDWQQVYVYNHTRYEMDVWLDKHTKYSFHVKGGGGSKNNHGNEKWRWDANHVYAKRAVKKGTWGQTTTPLMEIPKANSKGTDTRTSYYSRYCYDENMESGIPLYFRIETNTGKNNVYIYITEYSLKYDIINY
jgi:hypothetical protein